MWGKEVILDCTNCELERVTEESYIIEWLNAIVRAIDMVPFGEPILRHFGKHDERVAGYTLVQLIETSSITCHFCDLNGHAYINIFSCKDFHEHKVKGLTQEHFRPKYIKTIVLDRDAQLPVAPSRELQS